MKFGKVLKVSSENMPAEMHNLFLRYKELKKQIKLIPVGKAAAVGNEQQASVSPDGSSTGSGSAGATVTTTVLSPEEQAFINTLNEDLARFNRYFIEKEEEAVIRLQALCDELVAAATAAGLPLPAVLTNAGLSDPEDAPKPAAVSAPAPQARAPPAAVQPPQAETAVATEAAPAAAGPSLPAAEARGGGGPSEFAPEPTPAPAPQQQQQQQQQHAGSHHHHHGHHHHQPHLDALQGVKSRLVQFHGEMVLLLHWSLLNYAAVVKILKKHDKRTGVLLRAPYLANVLQQPFSSTTIMSRLAKRAEELVVATTQMSPAGVQVGSRPAAEHHAATGARVDSGPAATATDTAVAVAAGGVAAGESSLRACGGAVAGPSGREAPSASEVSSAALAAERDVPYAAAPGLRAEPLVGSTMHALETWAALRKNAVTPSTVLTVETEQQAGTKRKAEAPDTDAAAAVPASKAAKPDDTAAL